MQKGQIVKISGRWYVRYWEKRNVDGAVQPKRVSHPLGPATTRGKHPPKDVEAAAAEHMATVNGNKMRPEHIVTLGDFVETVYLPWVKENKRPSTAKGYREIWQNHLEAICRDAWLKDIRTYHVQCWLDEVGNKGLSRNSMRHVKATISAILKLAKQRDYFNGENPVRDTALNPKAKAPEEQHAYSLEEVTAILAHLPEPAGTAFAIAAFAGLRVSEIEGLRWEDYRAGELHITRSRWNGHESPPKTAKSAAPVPVIRQLAECLEMHRLRSGNPKTGPVFANSAKDPLTMHNKPLNMHNLLGRVILPALNRCEICHHSEAGHAPEDGHEYKRDAKYPEWHGWHAARRGLATNLDRLGVLDTLVQRILRHSSVATTRGHYIKSVERDVRDAMERLEMDISWTPTSSTTAPN